MSGVRLWDYAVAAYARPGVESVLLELQDRHGQCAPFLLWALWSAAERRSPSPKALAEAAAVARRWEGEVTGPLRALRQRLKEAPPDDADADRAAIRAKVKALELDGERMLLERLETLAPFPAGADDGARPALKRAAAAFAGDPPAALLERLASLAA